MSYPVHRRPRTDRRSPERRSRRDRRDDRLVLLPPVRLAQRVRVPAGRPPGRPLRVGAGDAGAYDEADVHAGHRHPRDAVPLGVGDRRGRRLHADRPAPAWCRTGAASCGWCGASAARSSSRRGSSRGSTTPASRTRCTSMARPRSSSPAGSGSASPACRRSSATATMSGRGSRCGPGETGGFVLESGASGTPQPIGDGEVIGLYLETEAYWQRWLEQSTYRGRWREAVERSAIALKLMTYAPSGGLVAAPTAGLPEQVGGSRNWDYRYTWVRDGSFSVYALLGLGFTEEAAAFGDWLRARVEEQRWGRVRAAQDHVPGRRQLGSHRGDARSPRRIHGFASGADRQRRRRPAAARHLRRSDELDPRPRQRRARRLGRRPRRLEPHRRHDRLALRALARPRRGHLGDARWPASLRLRAAHVLGGVRPCHPHGDRPGPPRRPGPLAPRARPHPRTDHDQGLERPARRLRPVRGR